MLAGVLAGLASLGAQCMVSAAVLGGTGSEPLQRIAAILLGPDSVRPAEWTGRLVGVALIIHLSLSALYGRLIDLLLAHLEDSVTLAAVAGTMVGMVLYVVNMFVIAPIAFPWFEASRSALAAADHALFGAITGLLCVALRRRLPFAGDL